MYLIRAVQQAVLSLKFYTVKACLGLSYQEILKLWPFSLALQERKNVPRLPSGEHALAEDRPSVLALRELLEAYLFW